MVDNWIDIYTTNIEESNIEIKNPRGFTSVSYDLSQKVIHTESWVNEALAPFKQIPATAFMLYMAPNSLGMSIGMIGGVLYGIYQQLKSVSKFKGSQRLAWIAGLMLNLSLIIWKFWMMGLVPTLADWEGDIVTGSEIDF